MRKPLQCIDSDATDNSYWPLNCPVSQYFFCYAKSSVSLHFSLEPAASNLISIVTYVHEKQHIESKKLNAAIRDDDMSHAMIVSVTTTILLELCFFHQALLFQLVFQLTTAFAIILH